MIEYKIFDTYNSVQTDTSGSWSNGYIDPVSLGCLFAPKRGYKIDERVGNKVYVHKMELRIGFCMPPGVVVSTDQPQGLYTRILLFRDKQTNGDRIDGAKVFQYGGSTPDVLVANYFVDNLDRIEPLWDDTICTNIDTMVLYVQPPPVPISYIYPSKYQYRHVLLEFKKPIIVKYYDSVDDGDLDDCLTSSFHLIASTNDTPNSANPAGLSVVYQCRTWYTDV